MSTKTPTTWKYPETTAEHLQQGLRVAGVSAAIGAVANVVFSAIGAGMNYLAAPNPTLRSMTEAANLSGGVVGTMLSTAFIAYALWPRYTVWQDDHYYDWHMDHKSDLPFRQTGIAALTCAATSVALSFALHAGVSHVAAEAPKAATVTDVNKQVVVPAVPKMPATLVLKAN